MTKPITIRFDSDDLDSFRSMYPQLLARFLGKCLRLALKDKTFFEKIFFSEV